jgi:hypothetical protein
MHRGKLGELCDALMGMQQYKILSPMLFILGLDSNIVECLGEQKRSHQKDHLDPTRSAKGEGLEINVQ